MACCLSGMPLLAGQAVLAVLTLLLLKRRVGLDRARAPNPRVLAGGLLGAKDKSRDSGLAGNPQPARAWTPAHPKAPPEGTPELLRFEQM
jgi:hypothetical protein